jgi:hypothetical protein
MKLKPVAACIVILLISFSHNSFARTYYVSPTGSDLNVGYDINAPFYSMKKALGKSDLTEIIVRGGIHGYSADSTVSVNKIGTAPGAYTIRNYPGETVIFDCSRLNPAKKGFSITGNYWYITGITIIKARDNGMYVTGANNIIELCVFSENEDSGLQLSAGANRNKVINCDSYYNKDATNENADGFACKLDVGDSNYFKGCRAWQNSDDGWDGYLRPSDNVSTTIENCWAFRNGYLKTDVISGANGDGNGFKMGGSDATDLRHNQTLTNCMAFYNRKRGFDQNNNRGSMTLYNNTAFANAGGNFSMNSIALASGSVMTVKNCVALNANGSAGTNTFVSGAVLQNNSFQQPFATSLADFASIDTVGARGPRKPDGSLPDLSFMHLVQSSDLIDGGQNVGLAFNGTAPDLGAFEFGVPTAVITYTFTGNGNWTDAANWANQSVPPASVNSGNQIIINPSVGGQCILNITYHVAAGAVFTVMAGKQLTIPLNLTITN